MIAARTRAALAAAKARGVILGGWRGGRKVDGQLGAEANKKQAEAFAEKLAPLIGEMRDRGVSLREMAAELTTQGIRTPRGGQWCREPSCHRMGIDRAEHREPRGGAWGRAPRCGGRWPGSRRSVKRGELP